MLAEYTHSFRVKGYSVVSDVPCQLDTKAFPDLLEFILVSYLTTPIIHFLELRSNSFSYRFHFWDYLTGFAAAQVESESQEVESTLFVAFACLKS